MNIKKNRLVIPLGVSCTYCDVEWCFMHAEDRDTVYYDPEDGSLICKPCHEEYGSVNSTVESDPEA